MAPIPHGNNNDIHNPSQQYLTWNRITLPPGSIVPPRRSGAASVVVKGKLYMFGVSSCLLTTCFVFHHFCVLAQHKIFKLTNHFWYVQGYGGGTGRLDDFYSYAFNSSDPKWERVTVLGHTRPGCRENNGVVIGDCSRMYLFGGYNGSTWLNDLWMFDIDTRQWTCIQESTSTATATIVGERGGEGGGNGGEEHSDGDPGVLVAPAAGGEHRREGSLAGGIGIGVGAASLSSLTSSSEGGPSRRFGYVSVVHNNKFVLFGGFDGARWLNDMFEFDLCTKTWKRIDGRGSLPSMRSCPAWAKDDRYVYIHGVSSWLCVCLLGRLLVYFGNISNIVCMLLFLVFRAMMVSNVRLTSSHATYQHTHGQNCPVKVQHQVHDTSTPAASMVVSCMRMAVIMAVID